jgi:hypothetical protein
MGLPDLTIFQSVNHERHKIQTQSHMTLLTAYQRGDGCMSQYVDHWLLKHILHMTTIPQLIIH